MRRRRRGNTVWGTFTKDNLYRSPRSHNGSGGVDDGMSQTFETDKGQRKCLPSEVDPNKLM